MKLRTAASSPTDAPGSTPHDRTRPNFDASRALRRHVSAARGRCNHHALWRRHGNQRGELYRRPQRTFRRDWSEWGRENLDFQLSERRISPPGGHNQNRRRGNHRHEAAVYRGSGNCPHLPEYWVVSQPRRGRQLDAWSPSFDEGRLPRRHAVLRHGQAGRNCSPRAGGRNYEVARSPHLPGPAGWFAALRCPKAHGTCSGVVHGAEAVAARRTCCWNERHRDRRHGPLYPRDQGRSGYFNDFG